MAVFLSPVGGVAAQFFTNTGAVLTGGKLYTYAAGTTTPAATYTSAAGVTFNTNPIILDAAGRVPSSGEIWLTDGTQYKFVLKDSNDVLIASYDNITGINSNFLNFNALEEIQTATAGQTVFTLTNAYTPGTNTLQVFVDGVNQYDGSSYAYTETSSTSVTFTAGLHVGALVKFSTAVTLSAGVTDASLVTYQPAGSGAVATTVQTKLRESVSVMDFGATGDGITDDTAAFTAAFAAVAASGQSVYIPSGTYLVDEISLTNGIAVGNGNKYGQTFYGDGVGKTILKCSGTKNKFLSFLGSPGNYFYTRFSASNFSIDMVLMPNASTSIGVYGIYAFGGNVTNVDVINSPASAISLYLDQGCYTTVWTNCDFGGTTGRVKLQGVGGQSVTTQTFIGSSWGQFVADNCSANSINSCIVQGDLTPKFVLSEQYGLYISGCDFEGTGVLYSFGTNANQISSINNALVGFSGTYSTGTPNSSLLLDQIYPLTSTGNPFIIQNMAVTSAAVTNGECVALKLNGTVNESVDKVGLTRKNIQNTSGGASIVDIQFSNANGSTYVGQTAAGNSYLDARGTTKVTLQQNGTDRLGVNSTGTLLFNTTTASTAGAIAGYLDCTVGGVAYKIPYYAV